MMRHWRACVLECSRRLGNLGIACIPVVATLPVPIAQIGSYAITICFQWSFSMTLLTASSCFVTTSTVVPFSRSSKLSPQHKMTPMPPFTAVSVFLAMNSSSSRRIVRLSECPSNVQVMPESFSCSTEISPVKAPFGLSKQF